MIVLGTLIFACAAAACALSQSIDQLILMRFLHGLSAAAGTDHRRLAAAAVELARHLLDAGIGRTDYHRAGGNADPRNA
ncbi:hypothetical protein E05_23820 [Plautia stali symbiont]|nr:hypothetical protein E05_23820 [Plautia stali symbiont]